MISFTLTDIKLGQIDQSLTKMPEYWEKVKGWSFLGCGLELTSQVNRRLQGQNLLVREWTITRTRERMKLAAFFLTNSNLESCHVILTCPGGLDEDFVRMLMMSLLSTDDPSQVDVSSYMAQSQT
jgi:hypothetical protein